MTTLSGCGQITTVIQPPPVIATRLEPAPEIRSVLAVGQGPSGPPGPAGDARTLIAATTLSGHRVLAIDGDGHAIYAQHSDATALAVQGLSTQSGVAGDELEILQSGPVDWPAGGLTPGAPLFLGADGLLTHTPPATGWVRQIAVATDSDTISIDIGPAYRVGD